MRKDILKIFIQAMSILFVAGTISILLMIYRDIDNSFSDRVFIGYIVVLFTPADDKQ